MCIISIQASVDELIQVYFHREYPYQAIVGLLEKQDGVRMHVRTLKRKLKDLGLKRKAANHGEDIIRELINSCADRAAICFPRTFFCCYRLLYS